MAMNLFDNPIGGWNNVYHARTRLDGRKYDQTNRAKVKDASLQRYRSTEPFNGVDPRERDMMREIFKKLSKETEGDYYYTKATKNTIAMTQEWLRATGSWKKGDDPIGMSDLLFQWRIVLGLDGPQAGQLADRFQLDMTSAICTANLHEHHRHGQQTFVIGDNLLELLEGTELTGVRIQDVKLPYDCFYVSIPKGYYHMWGGSRTLGHDVEGVFIRKPMYFEVDPKYGVGEFDLQTFTVCSHNQ